ncbi:YSIRK-type signal peptide-containing protein, partial [Staphylococcus aureus]
MRKKSGPINKRVDFLSNRLNKYSIRKFTIGTASILVGSTLIFGIGSGEAKADEKVYTNNENGTKSKHEKSEVESAPEAKATESVQETNKVESAPEAKATESVQETNKVESAPEAKATENVQETNKVESAPEAKATENVQETNKVESAPEAKATESVQETNKVESAPEAKATESVQETNKVESAPEAKATESVQETNKVESAPEAKATENVQETNKVESAQQQDKGKSVEANEKSFYDLSKKIDQAVNKKEVVEKQVKKQFSSVLSEKKIREILDDKNITFDTMSGEEIVSEVYKEIFKEISLNIDKNSLPPVITNRFFAIDSLSDAESINNQQENSSKLVTLESYKIYGPHQTGTLNASDPNTKENQAIKLVPGPGIGNKEKNRTAIYAPNTIDFRKDFNMNFDIALWPQGMSSRPDGLGFMFSKSTPEEYLSQGGILNDSGVSNAFGFKIDTYNNGNVDNLEKDFSKEKGASPKAYGTFVYNDANGTTHSYTKYPLDNQNRQQKNNLFNGFTQAFNGFRGQQYNTVNINYNADSGKLTVNYAGLTWTALLSDIGADKNSRYNFGIISSKETDRNVPGSYHTVKVNSASITYTPGSNDAQDNTPGYE